MIKLSLIQKICLTGLLIALTIVFTKVISIQNIPIIPFVRISIGPAIIIFSSILLGPIYGGVVGGLSDLLGYFIVDFSGRPPYFLISLMYLLMGVIPFFLWKLVTLIKDKKIMPFVNIGLGVFLYIFILVFMLLNDSITLYGKTYVFEAWSKTVILVVAFVLFAASFVAIYFINRHFKKQSEKYPNCPLPLDISAICLIVELLLPLLLGSVLKMHYFEVDFLVIFFSQAVVFFISVPLNTFIVTLLLGLSSRYYKGRL